MSASPTSNPSRRLEPARSVVPVSNRYPHQHVRSIPRWWLLSVFVVALLLRGGWGVVRLAGLDDPSALEFPDEQQYWSMASSLRIGEGLQDELGFQATRMPLYPGVLSLFAGATHGVIIAKVVQWVIGAVVAVLTAGVAATLLDRRVGLLAGLFVAFDPFLVFFSSLLLTETLFVAALVGLWWIIECFLPSGGLQPARCSARTQAVDLIRWVIVGLVAALCVYIRESSLGLVAVVLCFIAVCRRLDRSSLAGVAVVGVIVITALAPWAARNRHVIGEWCWLTTRAGISLYDGVGPQATGAGDLGAIKQMPAVRGMGEVEWNRYFLDESWKAIRADPGRIVKLAGTKLARLWNPFPNVRQYQSPLVQTISIAWTVPVFTLGVVGALWLSIKYRKDGLRIAFFLLLPALYVSILHSLFVGSVRYRLPAMPLIEILAAVALVAAVDRLRNYKLRITNYKKEPAVPRS